MPFSRAALSRLVALFVGGAILTVVAGTARADVPTAHRVVLGLRYVYDVGYDRGLHYGLGYELSLDWARIGVLVELGDTDPSHQQHWAINVGFTPIEWFRLDLELHHLSYPSLSFGENLLAVHARLSWRGLYFDGGWAFRFPIVRPDLIHSPLVFDTTLFETFPIYRLGYVYRFDIGLGLGLEAANVSRFEIQNFNYPMFSAVFSYVHDRIGVFDLKIGIGTNAFFSQGSTIDKFFVRLEYTRDFP